MSIEVQGPDGTIHEFPDGTSMEVMSRTVRRYYAMSPEQRAAKASAAAFGAQKRGLAERFGDVFSDVVNTSWIAAGWRQGRAEGAHAIPEKKPGLLPENPARALGKLSGSGEVLIRALMDGSAAKGAHETQAITRTAIAQEAERRIAFGKVSKEDPFWKADGGLAGKAAHGGAALLGTLAGAATDPLSYVGAGRTVLTRALTQAGVAFGADAMAQKSDEGAGLQHDFDVKRSALSAAAGFAFSGATDLVHLGAQRWAQELTTAPERRVAPALASAEEVNAPALSHTELPHEPPLPEGPAKVESSGTEAHPEVPPQEPHQLPGEGPEGPVISAPEAKADWSSVDWGKLRSSQRGEAAAKHLDKLKAWIRPEMVDDFVARIRDGEGPAEGRGHLNPDLVDWDHMNRSPEDLLEWVGVRADIFRDVYDHAGDGYRSWEATQATSRLFGSNLADVVKAHADITGDGGIAARMGALREAALESDRAFADTLKKVEGQVAAGDFSGLGELAQGVQRTVLFDAMAAGASSEVARALNYMKHLARPRKVTDLHGLMGDLSDVLNGGKEMNPDAVATAIRRLKSAYDQGGSPHMRDELRQIRRLGLWDYVGYVFTGNLLSSVKTHLRNLVGTPIHSTFQIAERYIAAGIGEARQRAGIGSKERVTFQEAMAYSTAMGDAMQEALRVGAQAFVRGAPIADPRSSLLPDGGTAQVPFALTRERMSRWVKGGWRLSTAVDVGLTGFYELIRTFGYRPSVAADEFYKALGRRMQVNALAYREAHYRSQLAKPEDADGVFKETLRQLQEEPTSSALDAAQAFFKQTEGDPHAIFDPGSKSEEMALLLRSIDHEAMAIDHARLLTFQNSGPVVDQFDRALRMVPVVKYLYVNFLRTPVALLRAGMIDRNPAFAPLLKDNRDHYGFLLKSLRDQETTLQRGGAEADLAVARLVMGSGLIATAWSLWAGGALVGRRGDGDTQKLDGVLPYSIRLPSGEWLQFSPASPLAEPFGLVADVAQAMRDHELDDGTAEGLMGALMAAVSNNVTNKTFLSGLNDLMDVLDGPSYGRSDKARGKQVGASMASTLAARLVPLSNLLRTQAQDQDPVVRDARSLLDRVKATVPKWSESLPAKRDFLGRPVVVPEGRRGSLQAFSVSKPTDDALEQEIARLGETMSLRIRLPARTFNGEPVTSDEYSRLLEVQGQLLRNPHTGENMEEALRRLVASPEYQEGPDLMREDRVKLVIALYRRQGRRAVSDPSSPFYMAEMVKRTGAAHLRKDVEKRGLDEAAAARRAHQLGFDLQDPESPDIAALRKALFPSSGSPAR